MKDAEREGHAASEELEDLDVSEQHAEDVKGGKKKIGGGGSLDTPPTISYDVQANKQL